MRVCTKIRGGVLKGWSQKAGLCHRSEIADKGESSTQQVKGRKGPSSASQQDNNHSEDEDPYSSSADISTLRLRGVLLILFAHRDSRCLPPSSMCVSEVVPRVKGVVLSRLVV